MKAILTGASGFIGGGVLEQCLKETAITSIVVLCRRPLPEPLAHNKKLDTVIMEDFTKYSTSVLEKLKDADFGIWCIGDRVHPTVEVEVGYSMAFCEAMAKARGEVPSKVFRMVYLSGMFATSDQTASLWFLSAPRKAKVRVQDSIALAESAEADRNAAKGLAETKLLEFSEQQKQKQREGAKWETYVVKPGGVLSKGSGALVTAIFGSSLAIRIEVLAKAMVEIATNGGTEGRIDHAALVRNGRAGLQQAK